MMREEEVFRGRILDLANRCYQQSRYTFSGFLSMGEQALFFEMEKDVSFVPWTLYGGGEDCERRMLRFGSAQQLGYEEAFPIRCLTVRPTAPKFADRLTHRDFLGALMNLGINRDVLGDIIVKNNVGYVFCEDAMAEYLKERLDKVRHTSISCEIAETCPAEAKAELSDEECTVSSGRCDAVIAKVFGLSRGAGAELFREGRVFVNGRPYANNSGILKDGDVVSVRGFGKFIFSGVRNETKKGRIRVGIRRYI